jgi:hypothetical protein
MKRKHQMHASAELSFRDRAASIRWVADRMGESERAVELRVYADELDQMADQMERATKPVVSTLESTDRR